MNYIKSHPNLILLCVISLIFFYPIIYGSGFHEDDISRINKGAYDWDMIGRYFAEDIAQFYSFYSDRIIDITPLNWFVCIFLVAFSSYLLFLKFKKENFIYAMPLSVVFIFNPFLIENVLFRYDSIGMILALTFVVLAFSLPRNKVFLFLSTLCLLISLNFYQAFVNLFLGLIGIDILLASLRGEKNKQISICFVQSIIIFLVANTLYLLELKIIGNNTASRGELLPLSSDSLSLIFTNLMNSYQPFFEFWKPWSIFIVALIPIALFAPVKMLLLKRVSMVFWLLLCSVIIFSSSLGGLALLSKQFIAARGLAYFPILLMFIAILIIFVHKNFKWLMVSPLFICLVFSYRVGNLQKIQSDYARPVYAILATHIGELKNIKKFYSLGELRASPFVKDIRANTPFGGFLFRGSWQTIGRIWEYTDHRLVEFEWDHQTHKTRKRFEELSSSNTLALLKDNTPFYKIYSYKDIGYIIWEKN